MKSLRIIILSGAVISSFLLHAQNVGIGTAAPAFKLDVKFGSINTDSVYRINGYSILATPGGGNLNLGINAGRITTGINNTFSGNQAGSSNTTGYYNSFFGTYAGSNNSTGYNNLFFGESAGYANTEGFNNSFVGRTSGFSNTTGGFNTFVGESAGFYNSSGFYNSFFGVAAGLYTTSGSHNSFFGETTGYYNTTGSSNSFFGKYAGIYNTTGSYNTAHGVSSLADNTTGSFNTAIGYQSKTFAPALTNATAIGAHARVDCSNCLVLGSVNGINGATSEVNVGIGNNAPQFPLTFAPTLGDKISLWSNSTNSYGFGIQSSTLQIHTDIAEADIVFGYGSSLVMTENMRIKGNGNVGIGRSAPGAKLDINGSLRFINADCINNFCPPNGVIRLTPNLLLNATTDYAVIVNWDNINAGTDSYSFRVGNGDQADAFYVTYSGDAWLQGTFQQASDIRLKKDIIPLHNSLSRVLKLNGYQYHWKSEKLNSTLQTGVIAQEVRKIFPELVKEDPNGMLSVNYSGLIPVLIESTKELKLEIDLLKKQYAEILDQLVILQKEK